MDDAVFPKAGGLKLKVRDLVVRSKSGRTLLSLPSLDVPAGTALGIQGPNGAGKSTLLYALAGLLDEAEGSVIWGSIDLLQWNAKERAEYRADYLGIVFQDLLLFDEMGAVDNASLASLFHPWSNRPALRQKATDILQVLDLQDFDRNVATFSGGERQRVAIARALASDAPVLLADEPTASLDRDSAKQLIADFTGLAWREGKTLITVSHDPHLLDVMDRVLTVSDGQVSEG